ncbi:hypothetical protein B7463_g7563, partial [Scytalidium lignicola]
MLLTLNPSTAPSFRNGAMKCERNEKRERERASGGAWKPAVGSGAAQALSFGDGGPHPAAGVRRQVGVGPGPLQLLILDDRSMVQKTGWSVSLQQRERAS